LFVVRLQDEARRNVSFSVGNGKSPGRQGPWRPCRRWPSARARSMAHAECLGRRTAHSRRSGQFCPSSGLPCWANLSENADFSVGLPLASEVQPEVRG